MILLFSSLFKKIKKLSDYPGNKPVFTTIFVTSKQSSLTYISVDEEGDIQAFSDDEADSEDAKIISLDQLFELDPSLHTIYEAHNGSSFDKDSKTGNWIKS